MLSSFERRKDVLQELTDSGAGHVGRIAVIIAEAVRDVTREVGDWLSDVIELREAARLAEADAGVASSAGTEGGGSAAGTAPSADR
jgi:hypothetical protein